MKLTCLQLSQIIKAFDNLANAKPDLADKYDIKLFVKDYSEKIQAIREYYTELFLETNTLNKELVQADLSEERKAEINNKINEIAELQKVQDAKEIELLDFKADWLKYCDLTVAEELNAEKILNVLEK